MPSINKFLDLHGLDTLWDEITQYADAHGDKTYIYRQDDASTIWTINHYLNKNPSVTILEGGVNGSEVEGDIVYTNLNTITITFQSSISGIAYLN